MSLRGPAAADLQVTLGRQVRTLAERTRPWQAPDWAASSSNPGWSNADTLAHLVEAFGDFALGVERRADPTRPVLGDLPPLPAARLPALLTQRGERLVEVLGATGPAELVWHPWFRFSARTLAAVALCEVVLHRWDLIGPGDRGPEPRAARLVLQGLFASSDDSSASPAALLLHLSGRVRLEGRPGWLGPRWRFELPDEVVADRRPGIAGLGA